MSDDLLHRHLIGRQGSRRELNTPVLVIDGEALARNIAAMARFVADAGLKLRPHAKTHKCAEIARRQIAAGAVGQCCAKIGEAEALAAAGIHNLLITSPVVSAPAVERLAALNLVSDSVIATVDHRDNVHAIGATVSAAGGKPLDLIIDVDPGHHRTGVASPEAAVALLEAIRAEPALRYRGVQFYCGPQQHVASFPERAEAMRVRAVYCRSVIAALTAAGGAPDIITGGGTGTHRIDATLGLFTELQAGSYIFMDDQYRACDLSGDGSATFEDALMIDSRVVSVNTPGIATVDAGLKAFATDADLPQPVAGVPAGSYFHYMGDEQGALSLPPSETLGLGQMITLSVPHCDPTVDRYDHYHVITDQTLVDIWPIEARGRSR